MGVSDWLAVVSLLISAVALFRPEMAKALTKMIGVIKFYPPSEIHVEYSTFGPAIAVNAVIASAYETIFLYDMSLVITRLADQSVHKLHWRVFRKLNYLDLSKSELEPAAAVTLNDTTTQKLNILFSDVDVVSRLNPLAAALQSELISSAKTKWGSLPDKDSKEFQRFSEAFRNGKPAEASALVTGLAREFYWLSGSYYLDIHFLIGERNVPIKRTYSFQLTAKDEQNLRGNYPVIVEDITGKKGLIYAEARTSLIPR